MILKPLVTVEKLLPFTISMVCGSFLTFLLWWCFAGEGVIDDESWMIGAYSPISVGVEFLVANLGSAFFAFVIVSTVYFHLLRKLKTGLTNNDLTLLDAKNYTMKLQALSSLFFGVGVLWTAIGMRSALMLALGDLDADSAAQLGAFEILKRLVDGGILIALSTTIVGGFGGYLMKLLETFTVASQIQELADEEDQCRYKECLTLLISIEANTKKLHLGEA